MSRERREREKKRWTVMEDEKKEERKKVEGYIDKGRVRDIEGHERGRER